MQKYSSSGILVIIPLLLLFVSCSSQAVSRENPEMAEVYELPVSLDELPDSAGQQEEISQQPDTEPVAAAVFTQGMSASVIRIVTERNGRVQVFLRTNESSSEEKQLDLRGGAVHTVLQNHIVEGGGIVYDDEGLRSTNITSDRLIAVINPDGSQTSVLDLFPSFSQQALKVSFPYAFEKRLKERQANR